MLPKLLTKSSLNIVMKKCLLLFVLLLAASTAPAVSTIDLNGDWLISGFDPAGTRRISDLSGRVPGQVHPDLERAGLIADPFWRDQADICQWVETYEWRYRRTFTVPAGFSRQWAVLQFDGLDTFATILLNGKELGRTDNMFIPHEFEVSKWLREGENTIEVRFAPPVAAIADKPYRKQFAVFDATGARTYIRRMQCGFGWDWVHRLVSAGIWRSCRIVSYPEVRVNDVFAWTSALSETEAQIQVEVTSTLRNKEGGSRLCVAILDPKGEKVWQNTVQAKSGITKMEAQITRPQWWWPNGLGAHTLYQVTAEVVSADDQVLQQETRQIGLRTVSIEEIPDTDNKGKTFTLVINGTRVFAKGGNWVPADPFPSRVTPDKYNRLIGQARDAGVNILRSWGGGIYEPEAFWEACDRMGIMVSQDFLLACADYPEADKAFTAGLKNEFATAARLLRNHPSLVFWCGDNELGLNSGPDKDWNFKKFQQEVNTPMMKELDPSRPFRLTSPYGGLDKNNSPRAGDSHRASQLSETMYDSDMRDYRKIIDETYGRFMSEHSTGGSPPKRTLLRFMNESDLVRHEMWEYHTSDNPYLGRKQGLTIGQVFEREANLLYGNPGDDVDRRIRQQEYLQYEFVRLGLEGARRRKFDCSGIQLWMFNDCWPAIGWSVLDYWGNRKASWYALAAGCRPVMSAAEVTTNAVHWWVSNDQLKPADVTLEIRVQPWSGKTRWSKKITLTVPANSSVDATNLSLDEIKKIMGNDSALVCDLDCAADHDRSWWFPGLPLEMKLPSAKLQVSERRGEGEGAITIHAENWARVVTLDANVDFSDNYFELMPGETRTINWKAPERSFSGKIGASCWNP